MKLRRAITTIIAWEISLVVARFGLDRFEPMLIEIATRIEEKLQ